MRVFHLSPLYFLFLLLLLNYPSFSIADHDFSSGNTIIFKTNGRSFYAFDVYSLPILESPNSQNEIQITDGRSVNYNGHFPSPSSSSVLLSLLPNQSAIRIQSDPPPLQLVYVTERNDGISNIYLDAVYQDETRNSRRRSALESTANRIQIPLLDDNPNQNRVSMKDKPTVTGEYLVYVSTHEDSGVKKASWAAVYSTHLKSGSTRRLTPYGVADFSPAVSPSGIFTAVASYGEKGWTGEIEDLTTDIYVFLTRDGTQRVKVVEHGGWPAWVDDRTLYFHRRGDDQWWSVYRATLPAQGPISTGSVLIERVTPPGIHAFTPATSPGNYDFIAVATRRPDSGFRHIELFDLVNNEFRELTRLVSPDTHHLNPFISPDSKRVGYHKCRGELDENKTPQFVLENIRSPVPDLTIFRFIGSFPAFSPSGDRIVYAEMPGVYVVNLDGSNRRKVSDKMTFSTSWDPVRPGVIYTSAGETFASESSEVDVISINVDDDTNNYQHKKLTLDGKNNAFPSPSPDGKRIVFRSGRTGHKNLYIMDAVLGEKGGLQRLTEGPWTDTMCVWSPDGEWIAFASDRDDPGSVSFEMYLIHPNGTGLRKLLNGSGGRANHMSFSPDGKSIVFTSNFAGISAEPISTPHQYQPYGEIYIANLDGSRVTRLTHNSYEDGTPAWSPKFIKPIHVKEPKGENYCGFEDCHWLYGMPNTSYMGMGMAAAYGMILPKSQCGA